MQKNHTDRHTVNLMPYKDWFRVSVENTKHSKNTLFFVMIG